ncbi:MAG: sigma-54 dependent transcriptional regulator [Acidobacteria bacterium]|nr:sigma-54 dependent transcriptional regulator [Acidobacteriota bacterium]
MNKPLPAGSLHAGVAAAGATLERFPLADAGERWRAFLSFDHASLPLPIDYGRDGGDFLVWRTLPPRRRIADGRISAAHAAALFLQAAAFFSTLEAASFRASADDLEDAAWEVVDGTARLAIARTPSAVRLGPASAGASKVPLAAFLRRLFARRGRLRDPQALALEEALRAGDAEWRRGDFWVGCAFRTFPVLSSAAFAAVRLRTVGATGILLRGSDSRARLEKARALLEGKDPKVFLTAPDARAQDVAAAVRLLREEEEARPAGGPRTWICVGMETWGDASRSAVAAGALCVAGAPEILRVPERLPPPASPEAWRREIAVPCGALRASVRFSEKLAEIAAAAGDPTLAVSAAFAMVAHEGWGAYVSDPTGLGSLPPDGTAERAVTGPASAADLPASARNLLEAIEALEEPAAPEEVAVLFPGRAAARTRASLLRKGLLARDASGRISPGNRRCPVDSAARSKWLLAWARAAGSAPSRRIERLLRAGAAGDALSDAAALRAGSCAEPPALPLELSARLASAAAQAGLPLPPWLEALEGERELSGGRAGSAQSRFEAVAAAPGSPEADRRAAGLRLAEIASLRGRGDEASAAARLWLASHREAPAGETVRALIVEAGSASREGDTARALARLDEAASFSASLPAAARLEIALARAAALSRAGRFEEESRVYADSWPIARESGDERLVARLLAAEALGLADRREFDPAIRRLEEALAILRDDPVERARLSIDLAATLFHAGRPERCAALLEQAAALAAGAGREDLGRIARGNLIEASLDRCDWASAETSIEALLESARREGERTWLLVGLHHRARLALRVGRLEDAARDNAAARELAGRLEDRLEIGELWLEEGDRCALLSDIEGARRAWSVAAADPPDRCDSDRRAARRLADIDGLEGGGPGAAALLDAATDAIARGEYVGAEAVARWNALFPGRIPAPLADRADRLLRARGGAALADRAFARPEPSGGGLSRLREMVALGLAGEAPEGHLPLGLTGLSVRNDRGEEILSLGAPARDADPPGLESLRAGDEAYTLRLTPAPAADVARAAALVVETLLFRPAPALATSGFSEGWRRFGVVAGDSAMEEPYRRLMRFAPRAMTVLILGESGSGKEAVARAVHALSPRAPGPFVAVNVSAIPTALLESELFGHARGAFTGADRDRAGLLEEAARGTIFFDEIGDLALTSQAKLLRALQDRDIRRVGENKARRIDVRVVSATSRDLPREVDAGRFREDLYYRLHVAVIRLPPLRERGRDVLLLARHFLAQAAGEYGCGGVDLAPEAAAALLAHAWPGNVRELQSAIGQAAALAEGGRIGLIHLPEAVRKSARPGDPRHGYRSRVDAHRRDLIMEALDRAGGNRSRAARELKLSRQALLYLIRELKVAERPRDGGGRTEAPGAGALARWPRGER